MSNHYRDKRLTAEEELVLQHMIDRMQTGTWSSTTEMNAAMRHFGSFTDGPMGDLYRRAWDQKGERTLATGVSLLPEGSRVSDIYPSTAKQAGAVRNADGSVDVGILEVDQPNGRPVKDGDDDQQMAPQDASGGRYGEGVRVVNRPGGVTQVSVRSGLPLITPTPAAEKRHREEYLRRVDEKRQGIPTIPEKK